MTMPILLGTIYGCFHATIAEASSCDRACLGCKADNISIWPLKKKCADPSCPGDTPPLSLVPLAGVPGAPVLFGGPLLVFAPSPLASGTSFPCSEEEALRK